MGLCALVVIEAVPIPNEEPATQPDKEKEKV